jgi:hypothetical protein
VAESVPAEGDPRRVQAVAKLMFDSIDQKLARIASIARAAEDRGLPGNLKSLTGVSRLLPGTEMVRSKEEGIQIWVVSRGVV